MRNIIKKKCYIRRIFIVFMSVVCFSLIVCFLNFLYEDVESGKWERFIMHHFYENDENIDNLYLGSSHLYCGINPDILNEKTGQVNFNLSTGSQKFSESYLLLQEADKKNDIEHVFLEMYYAVHTEEYLYSIQNHFRLLDEIKDSWRKQKLICELEPGEELLAVYLPFVRYRQEIFNVDYIKKQIIEKNKFDYRDYRYYYEDENGIVEYHANGFMGSSKVLEESKLLFAHEEIEQEPITEEALDYLLRIIRYCKENQIKLTLFSVPVYELQMYGTTNYDAYVEQVKKIAAANQLEYYDFNLCKEEYLPIQKLDYFSDMGHLNSEGAELFSEVFYDVVANKHQDWFYDTYQEKLEMTEPTVYGFISEIIEDTNIVYTIAANEEEVFEYRIEFIIEETDERVLIQDYSMNTVFYSSNGIPGYFLVSIRRIGEEESCSELKMYQTGEGINNKIG